MTRLVTALFSVGILLSNCAGRTPVPGIIDLREPITLYRHRLEIRMSKPAAPSTNSTLVIYATGDGGWHGLDERIFDWIRSWGYPVAGISSKGYLKNLGYVSETTTPRHLVRDFESIINFAEDRLEMPRDTPIILVGLSRGAGLAVVAAGQGGLKNHLAGVVAVALTKEEEHVVHHRRFRLGSRASIPRRELVEIKTYDYLPRLAGFPLIVIQSTHDGYLPAAAARALFGPDTEIKKLLPVEARNHRFSGGGAALYKDTRDSLEWIQDKLARRLTGLTR